MREMNNLKAIFFDFDGTLANTIHGILACMRETYTRMGIPIPDSKSMAQTIGLPLDESLRQAAGLSREQTQEATELYCRLFPQYEIGNVTIFPGVLETLDTLQQRGLRLAIATSRDMESLQMIMRPRGMEPLFEQMTTASDNLQPKPAPELVEVLLKRMGLTPDEVLVVGDTIYDIEMGKAAGCRTCAVTYGNHPRERLLEAEPEFMIDSMPELLELL